MTWLSLALAAVKAVAALVSFLETRKLLEAGEAQAILRGLETAEKEIRDAMQAREDYRAARRRGDIGPDDDDGYRRD